MGEVDNFFKVCKEFGGSIGEPSPTLKGIGAVVCNLKNVKITFIPERSVVVEKGGDYFDIISPSIHFEIERPSRFTTFFISPEIQKKKEEKMLKINVEGGFITIEEDNTIDLEIDVERATKSIVAKRLGLLGEED